MDEQQDKDITAIGQQIEEAFGHFNANNIHAMTGYYTKDCNILFPGGPGQRGHKAVQDVYRPAHDVLGIARFKMDIDKFHIVQKDMAVLTILPTNWNADNQVMASFKSLQVWKKEGEDWRVHIAIINPNPSSSALLT